MEAQTECEFPNGSNNKWQLARVEKIRQIVGLLKKRNHIQRTWKPKTCGPNTFLYGALLFVEKTM